MNTAGTLSIAGDKHDISGVSGPGSGKIDRAQLRHRLFNIAYGRMGDF